MFGLFVLILMLVHIIFPFKSYIEFINHFVLPLVHCVLQATLQAALPPSFYFLIMLSKGGRLGAGRGQQ